MQVLQKVSTGNLIQIIDGLCIETDTPTLFEDNSKLNAVYSTINEGEDLSGDPLFNPTDYRLIRAKLYLEPTLIK